MLCGCYDSKETDSRAYAVSMGADKTDSRLYRITFQIIAPLNIESGVETAFDIKSEKSPLLNYTVEAQTVDSAIEKADDLISKKLDLSQLKCIFINKDSLSNELKNYLSDEKKFRDNIYIVFTEQTAEETMKYAKSPLELNPSKYYETLFSEKFSQYSSTTYLWEVLNQKNFTVPAFKTTYTGISPDGTYLVKNNEAVHKFSLDDTLYINILKRSLKSITLNGKKSVIEKNPCIKNNLDKKSAVISIKLSGEIEDTKILENGINKIINLTQDKKCDAFGLKNSQKKLFPDFSDYKKKSVDIEDMKYLCKVSFKRTKGFKK